MNIDILIATIPLFLTLLTLMTALKIKEIIKRDGPAKLEVNKRYDGVILDHAEAIEPTSLKFIPFYAMFLPPLAPVYFKDFEEGDGWRFTVVTWLIRAVLASLIYVFVLQGGFVLTAVASFILLITQSLVEEPITHYYYLRYYEVEFEIEYEEDENDKDGPDSDTDR